MYRNIALLALGGLAAAAPRPATDIPAVTTKAPTGTEPGAAPTRASPGPLTGPTSHGPYTESPTTIGNKMAPTTLSLSFDGPAIPNPTATYYNPDGELRAPAQFPFQPGGKASHHNHVEQLLTS